MGAGKKDEAVLQVESFQGGRLWDGGWQAKILRWDLRISSLWKTGWVVPASCSASCPGSSRVGWTFQTVLTCCGGAWIYIHTLTCHWGEAVPKSVSTPQSRYTVFSLGQHPEQTVSWPQTLGDNPTGRQAGLGWSSPQALWSRAFFGRWEKVRRLIFMYAFNIRITQSCLKHIFFFEHLT